MRHSQLVFGIVLAASTLFAAGCSKVIKKDSLEAGVKSSFEKAGIRFKSVDCPGDRPVKAGDTFECSAELEEGGKATVTVNQKNDQGHVTFDIVGYVFTEASISESVGKVLGTKVVDMKCNKKVAVLRKGETYTCEHKLGEVQEKIEYTVADDEKSVKAKVTHNGAEAAGATAPPPPADTPPVEADEATQ